MARDWKEILAEFQADEKRTPLLRRVCDDDGIFEALWSYVEGSADTDDGLAEAVTKKEALHMLLRLANSKDIAAGQDEAVRQDQAVKQDKAVEKKDNATMEMDAVCQALLMNKENSFQLLLDWARKTGDPFLVELARQAMRDKVELCLYFKYPGADLDHFNTVLDNIDSVKEKVEKTGSWYPLRLLHSVLVRAFREQVFLNDEEYSSLVLHATVWALNTIADLRRKAEAAKDKTLARQLRNEYDRWYPFMEQVSKYVKAASGVGPLSADQMELDAEAAGPHVAQSSHLTVQVPGTGSVVQPERKRPWGARPLEHAPLHSWTGSVAPPSSPVRTTPTHTDGQGRGGGVGAGEIQRRLVEAAVQGEQQLRDHLLALVAPELRAGSSESLQEFHRLKCLVRNCRDVAALFRFGASLAHWVASPHEGLGKHLSDLGIGLRAFADGLDEGLGTGEKYDTVMWAFATIGSKPGFWEPRGTALVLSEVVGCLEHAASRGGIASIAASTAVHILASILKVGGTPGQEAPDADAVREFSRVLSTADNNVPALQNFLQLHSMMEGEAREAMAHNILILLEYTGEKSQHVETLNMLGVVDDRLIPHLREGFSIEPGPWTLRLGLWLREALKDVLLVTLTQDPLLASLIDPKVTSRSFLLAAVLWGSGDGLSAAAASVLFGVPTTWWAELDGLPTIQLIQEFASCHVPECVDQVLLNLDNDQRAALLEAVLTHWADGPLQAQQRVPLMMLTFLFTNVATLSYQLGAEPERADMSIPVVKPIVDVARTFLKTWCQAESAIEDPEEYCPDSLLELQNFKVHMGSVLAGLACRCVCRPSSNGVRSVLQLAFQVLSNEPQKRWWAKSGRTDEGIAVLESVLGLLQKERPQPTLAGPQNLQALREMSDLVNLIREYDQDAAAEAAAAAKAAEAAANKAAEVAAEAAAVSGMVGDILRHLGAVGPL